MGVQTATKLASTAPEIRRSRFQRRAAAVLEVTGVFVAGNLAAESLAKWLGVANFDALLAPAMAGQKPDFAHLAWVALEGLIIQYVCLMGLVFAIGWWHRKRPASAYGITTGGHSWRYLIAAGVVLCAVAELPIKIFILASKYVHLGEGSAYWRLAAYDWDFGWWLLMAVGSFAVVPIVEELFFRGYFQTRLAEEFSPATAIICTTVFFAIGIHPQYLKLIPLNLIMLAVLIWHSLLAGYIFYRTRSLVVTIVAHVLVNTPGVIITAGLGPIIDVIGLVVVLTVIILARKNLAWYGSEVLKTAAALHPMWLTLVLVALFTVLGLAMNWSPRMLPVVALALPGALVLEYLEKRCARAPEHSS